MNPSQSQTFVGRSVKEAYARVRETLGRDAVILDQQRDGGTIRIVACADFPEAAAAPPATSSLTARLEALGFDAAFIEGLPKGVQSWQQMENLIFNRIPIAEPATLQGVLRFVGAPGSGKTTTIIKLMADHVLHKGATGCLLVSTDSRRLGGCEPLALAAELLGVKFLETTAAGFERLRSDGALAELTLVDTAGVSFGQAASEPVGCEDVLVVPATWQPNALRRLWLQLARSQLTSVALTHVDQCDTIGACLSVLSEWSLPLRWVSRGPELYDDLEPGSRKTLAEILWSGIDRSQMRTTFA